MPPCKRRWSTLIWTLCPPHPSRQGAIPWALMLADYPPRLRRGAFCDSLTTFNCSSTCLIGQYKPPFLRNIRNEGFVQGIYCKGANACIITKFIIQRVSFIATRSRCAGQSQRGQTDRSRSMRLLPATRGTLSDTERATCGEAAELIRECKPGLIKPQPLQRVPELTFAKGWHTLAGFFGRI